MHCAWLPLLKHFTNGISVPGRSAPRPCQPSVAGGPWRRRRGKKWSGPLESKQMALVLLSATAIWSLLKLITSSPSAGPPADSGTGRNTRTLRGRGSDFFSHPCLFWRSPPRHARTNVFISGPVKMSSLCLFQASFRVT